MYLRKGMIIILKDPSNYIQYNCVREKYKEFMPNIDSLTILYRCDCC